MWQISPFMHYGFGYRELSKYFKLSKIFILKIAFENYRIFNEGPEKIKNIASR